MGAKWSAWIVLLLATAWVTTSAAGLTLVQDGEPRSIIVLSSEPTASAKLASTELQDFLQKMSGAVVPIVSAEDATQSNDQAMILVGRSRLTDALGVDLSKVPAEGYLIRTMGRALVLAGDDTGGKGLPVEAVTDGDVRTGTLYAVYGFLSNELGCRWIWPGPTGEHVPKRSTVEVGSLDVVDAPALERRHMRLMMHRPMPDADRLFSQDRQALSDQERQWYLRMGLGRHADGPEGHSFKTFWDEYSQTLPEIFALLPSGERGYVGKPSRVKMCVGNPVLWDLLTERFEQARQEDPSVHALQACEADGRRGHCTCDLCRAMDATLESLSPEVLESLPQNLYTMLEPESDGLPGSVSTRYAKFLNEMCRRVRSVDPDGFVTMYAMTRLRQTPIGVTMEPNLMVNYVGFNSYPLTPAERAAERRDFMGWVSSGAMVVLRPNAPHYAGDGMPYNISREMADDFVFALNHGLVQAEYDAMLGYWASWGPTYYVLPRLMWEGRDADPEQLITEWYEAFGPARREMRAYYDFWEQHIRSVYNQPGWTAHAVSLGEGRGGPRAGRLLSISDVYTPAVLDQAQALLDAAVAAASDADPSVARMIENIQLNQQNAVLTARVAALVRASWDDPSQAAALSTARQELLAFRRSIAQRNAVNVFWETQYEIQNGDPFGWKSTPQYVAARP